MGYKEISLVGHSRHYLHACTLVGDSGSEGKETDALDEVPEIEIRVHLVGNEWVARNIYHWNSLW